MTTASDPQARRHISRVEAEGLFGQFNHELKFGGALPSEPNLLILYGENGTGKTTLLWLLYHLLSAEIGRGHRTFLSQYKFRKLSVTFSDGLEICAFREQPYDKPESHGFVLLARQGSNILASYTYTADKTGKMEGPARDPEHVEFNSRLPQFNLAFLPHSRLTLSDEEHPETQRWRLLAQARAGVKPGEAAEIPPILLSIEKAMRTARQQALTASNQGQFTANSIYSGLIDRLSRMRWPQVESESEETRKNLQQNLNRQSKTALEYSKFGLISELHVEGLLKTLESTPVDRLHLVDQVLEPFLRSNEARFEALKALYLALTTAVEGINSLYLNKRISLHLEKGLNILTSTEEQLRPTQLSSGEQELLILYCELISSLRPNTIFFIDEPELSLNITWQKVLLESLLRCASGTNIQFLVATHSIEILARHRANVTRLSNKLIGAPEPTQDSSETEA